MTWGFKLLAILLIIWGAVTVLDLSFIAITVVMGLLAIVSGILILMGR